MATRGHEVCVLTTGPGRSLESDSVNGVRVIRAGLRNLYWHFNRDQIPLWKRMLWHCLDIYNPGMGRIVRGVVAEFQPDVVSCHNLAGFSSSAWAALKSAGVPVVQVLHDYYNLCPSSNMFCAGRTCVQPCRACRLMRIPHIRLSNSVSAVVGISHFVLNRHLEFGRFSKVRLQAVIPNARRKIAASSAHTKAPGQLRFGFIGSLVPAKGVELLLEQFRQLQSLGHILYVAGEGEPEYRKRLRLSASDGVQFLGAMEASQFFPMIDVLVVPSLWQEPLGMVIVEAFMHGIPVLASRVGGIQEMVVDGSNGLLFDPESPLELRDKMQRLIDDAALLALLSEGAMSSASAYIDVDAWGQKYESLLNETMLSFSAIDSSCD